MKRTSRMIIFPRKEEKCKKKKCRDASNKTIYDERSFRDDFFS